MVSHIESCFANEQKYSSCADATQLGDTGVKIGPGEGEVTVTNTDNTFKVVAKSKAKTGTTNHTFTIEKTATGETKRSCAPVGKGGCPSGGATNW